MKLILLQEMKNFRISSAILAEQVSEQGGENDLLQQTFDRNGEGNVEGMLTDTIAELR